MESVEENYLSIYLSIYFSINIYHIYLSISINLSAVAGCDSDPCQNGAECVEPVEDSYECQCVDGTTGFNCETGTYSMCFISWIMLS